MRINIKYKQLKLTLYNSYKLWRKHTFLRIVTFDFLLILDHFYYHKEKK